MSLAEALKIEREKQDISRADLASMLDINVSTLSLWESGKGHPSDRIYKELIKLFPELPPKETLAPSTEASVTYNSFPEALAALRIRAGLSRPQLSKKLGGVVGETAIAGWEKRKYSPVQDNYDLLVAVLDGLKDSPKPDPRDINKPTGGEHKARKVVATAAKAASPSPTLPESPKAPSPKGPRVAMTKAPMEEPALKDIVPFAVALGKFYAGDTSKDIFLNILKLADQNGISVAELTKALEK